MDRCSRSKMPGAVANSLTDIHNTMMKFPFVVNGNCIHKGFCVSPQVKTQRIQVRWAWRSCSGASCNYPSIMLHVVGNISHSTVKMCRSSIMHSLSHNSQIKCFQAYVHMGVFLFLAHGSRDQSFSAPFTYILYIRSNKTICKNVRINCHV
jgi:hypothetical protein